MAGTAVFGCKDLTATASFFEGIGFRVDQIAPADDPTSMVLSGHGLQIRLDTSVAATGGLVEIPGDGGAVIAPNGVEVRYVSPGRPLVLPPTRSGCVVSRLEGPDAWGEGRAAMLYRDLIPGRFGGAYIASHINIAEGGPVPDSVHYHRIVFQLLYCYRGWVRVVYEDQGEPFVMRAGDAVLQPPEIRHRVLESSDAFEIIEIGCPAVHDTFFDHDLVLPTLIAKADRDFGGQTFVRHDARDSPLDSSLADDEPLSRRDLGMAHGTSGLVEASVVRLRAGATLPSAGSPAFCFRFVLDGEVELSMPDAAGNGDQFGTGDAVSWAGTQVGAGVSGPNGCEVLEVVVPALVSPKAIVL